MDSFFSPFLAVTSKVLDAVRDIETSIDQAMGVEEAPAASAPSAAGSKDGSVRRRSADGETETVDAALAPAAEEAQPPAVRGDEAGLGTLPSAAEAEGGSQPAEPVAHCANTHAPCDGLAGDSSESVPLEPNPTADSATDAPVPHTCETATGSVPETSVGPQRQASMSRIIVEARVGDAEAEGPVVATRAQPRGDEPVDSATHTGIITALTQELTASQAEHASLVLRLTELQAVVASREKQLETMAAGCMDDANKARAVAAAGSSRVAELERLLEHAESGRAVDREEAKRTAKALARAEARVGELEGRLAEVTAEVSSKERQAADTLTEGVELSKKLAGAEERARAARDRLRVVEDDLSARRVELSSAELTMDGLRARVAELEALLESTAADKDSAHTSAHAHASRLTSLEQEVAQLRAEAKSLRGSSDRAAREAEDARAALSRMHEELEGADKARDAADSAYQLSRSAEASAIHSATLAEDGAREVRRQLSALQAASASREDDLRAQVADVTARWRKALNAAEEAGVIVSGLSASSSSSPESGGGSTAPTAAGASTLASLAGQVSALQDELTSRRESWAAQRTALQARVTTLDAARARAEDEARRAEGAARDEAAGAAALRTELLALRSARARVDVETVSMVNRVHDAETRAATSEAALSAARRQIGDLSAHVSSLQRAVEEARSARASAQRSSEEARREVAALEGEVDAARREAAGASHQLSLLRRQGDGVGRGAPAAQAGGQAQFLSGGWLGALDAAQQPSGAPVPSVASFGGTSALALTAAAIETERDALAERVVALSDKVAHIENELLLARSAAEAGAAASSQVEVLLQLVGEQEEEVEEAKRGAEAAGQELALVREELSEARQAFRLQLQAITQAQ